MVVHQIQVAGVIYMEKDKWLSSKALSQ